jgi:hypothetical protein
MDGVDTIKGPEALQISIHLHCLCEGEPQWMQIVLGAAASGSFVNSASVSRFECPKCGRQVAAELLVQSCYDRPLA